MKRALRVSRDAEAQIRQAARWWRENRPAAPGLLHQELQRGFQLIVGEPGIGPQAADLTAPQVRRLLLARIRYFLYYRITGEDVVEVLAFWHTSRGTPPPDL